MSVDIGVLGTYGWPIVAQRWPLRAKTAQKRQTPRQAGRKIHNVSWAHNCNNATMCHSCGTYEYMGNSRTAIARMDGNKSDLWLGGKHWAPIKQSGGLDWTRYLRPRCKIPRPRQGKGIYIYVRCGLVPAIWWVSMQMNSTDCADSIDCADSTE